MSNDGGYIPNLDFWHWQHYWSSPWTIQVQGGLIPATPPNAGFTTSKPWPTLTSINGQPRIKQASVHRETHGNAKSVA